MANNAKAFCEEFKGAGARMKTEAPEVLGGFGTLFQSVMKDGALSVREKELVALGIAVGERCLPCINLHVQKCLAAGATRQQVIEAASVAVMMGGGPAYTHLPLVIEALDSFDAK